MTKKEVMEKIVGLAAKQRDDGDSGQESCEATAVSGLDRIGQRNGIADLCQNAQTLGQKEKTDGVAQSGTDDHPGGTHPHPVNKSGSADKPETTHGAGEDSHRCHDESEVAPGHKKIVRRMCSTHRPESNRNAQHEKCGDTEQNDPRAICFHGRTYFSGVSEGVS